MKKKLAIITIIIAGSILWVLTALAVCLRGTQTLAFTDTVQEAGSGVTYVKRSRTPVDFLPVGNECEFEITVDGPDEIVPTISISLESSKAEPIFTKTAKNGTFKTGKLNVGNKKIFLNFDYEPLPELDENKDYAVRYTIELTSGNYALYNSIMLTLAAVCILPLALSIAYLISLNENNKKAFDERQMKMRGKAAMTTMIVVIATALGLGWFSLIYNDFPLSAYECLMIIAFIGIATFAITADRYDAYMGLSNKRNVIAVMFSIIGIIDLVMFFSTLKLIRDGAPVNNRIDSLVQGICCLSIGVEVFIKNIQNKKEALEDEES